MPSSSFKSSKKNSQHEGFLEAVLLSDRSSSSSSSSGGTIMKRDGTQILYPGGRRCKSSTTPVPPAPPAASVAKKTAEITAEQRDEVKFTDEQDATIRRMKTKEKGKTWKDIAEAVGDRKSAGDCQRRWKVINAASTDKGKEANADKAADSGKKDDEGAKKDGRKKKGCATMMIPKADDHFNTEDLEILAELIKKEREMLWLRVASAFFDEAGKRLHPADIEEKFS